jgi:ABC-type antimicrobial peptide transport system permease subunit
VALNDGGYAVIGVVEDIRSRPGIPASPALYVPLTSTAVPMTQSALPVLVRMTGGAEPDQRLITARLNERFPPNSVRIVSASASIAPFVERPRFLAMTFGALLIIALALCVCGVYAVAVFEAAQRRRETAIRLALGASSARVRWHVLRQLVVPVAGGAAVGITAAWMALRIVVAQLPDAPSAGWPALLGGTLLVVIGAVAAATRPAVIVARTDPAAILRDA